MGMLESRAARRGQAHTVRQFERRVIEHGPTAMASALTALMNHAVQIEREQTLEIEFHQRTTDRQGYANRFKPKTMRTRVGEVALRTTQTRGHHDAEGRPFFPKSLERGVRSERAMTLAAWRKRPIGEVTYLILNAPYEKIRHAGAVVPWAVLGCSVEFS
jgi:transposase-like protein